MTYRITMNDVRDAGYCGVGLRSFCEQHGLSITQLVNIGWGPEDVAEIDDEHMLRVIAVAKARSENG